MRRKKHKHTRRSVRFYKINFGFRPPFKVLLDGNFVHTLETLKKADCKEEVIKLLGEQSRLFTTKCVMQELRSLGSDYSGTRQACKRYALHHCGHDDPVSATECLASQIHAGNPEHFFISTQDKTLSRRVMSIPGGAVIFATVNGIHLEQPSEAQKQHVQKADRAQQGPGEVEKRSEIMQKLTGDDDEDGEGGSLHNNKSVFRRNRAKGPNPLSRMPSKKKKGGSSREGASTAQHDGGDEAGAHKGKRQRRRRPPGEGAGGGNSD